MPQHVRPQTARLVIWIVVTLSLGARAAEARTLRVAKDGSGEFTVIQAAVNAAGEGDTVFVAAGRYPEHWITQVWGRTQVACVVVSRSSLCIVGESAESVIIGPEPTQWLNDSPVGIGAAGQTQSLHVERVGIINCYCHIMKEQGKLSVRDCRFQGGAIGAMDGAAVFGFDCPAILVERCNFQDCRGGIALWRCNNPVIRDNHFVDTGTYDATYFDHCQNVQVSDCTFEQNYKTGISIYMSTCEIRRCRITGASYYGIIYDWTLTDVLVEDCWISVPGCAIGGDWAGVLTANRNVLSGAWSTLYFRYSSVTLRDCHILNAGGYSVYLFDEKQYRGDYDLVGNWWGTTDAHQIDGWILDSRNAGTTVRYLPLLTQPVPTESRSLGGIKGMFR